MTSDVYAIRYEPRICESCGGDELEELWHYRQDAPTRNGIYKFSVRNVICKSCGFVFVSPAPSSESLARYYADSYKIYEAESPDYDIQKRLEFICKHLKGNTFVEIGSNTKGKFLKELKKYLSNILTVELNESTESDFRSLDDLPKSKADMIAHYFVLEHIPNVRMFLQKCYDTLKVGGVMICEVPDISLYPNDPSGLSLHEHLNHFSIEILSQITEQIGFKLKDFSSKLCSRTFGFSSAFIKTEERNSKRERISFYSENKNYFIRGIHNANDLEKNLFCAHQRLEQLVKQGKKIVFWAANKVLIKFLECSSISNSIPHKLITCEMPKEVVIIDSNPEKKNYFNKIQVFQPSEKKQAIIDSDVIFIFSKMYSDEILNSIQTNYGKSYHEEDIVIVDIS